MPRAALKLFHATPYINPHLCYKAESREWKLFSSQPPQNNAICLSHCQRHRGALSGRALRIRAYLVDFVMESQSGPPVNEEFQNAALPAPYDSSISQGSISMSKGEFVIASSPMRRRPTTKRAMASTLIKRSVSSPNVGAMASNEASSTSMSDKRRNKLGYHRTSVACGEYARPDSLSPYTLGYLSDSR